MLWAQGELDPLVGQLAAHFHWPPEVFERMTLRQAQRWGRRMMHAGR